MLDFPEEFVPNKTVMGAKRIGPVSCHALKFVTSRPVIIAVSEHNWQPSSTLPGVACNSSSLDCDGRTARLLQAGAVTFFGTSSYSCVRWKNILTPQGFGGPPTIRSEARPTGFSQQLAKRRGLDKRL